MNRVILTIVGVFLASSSLMNRTSSSGDAHGYPLSPVDQEINQLGAEEHIKSEQDADVYIEALLSKFQIEESHGPAADTLRTRLATAEYATVLDPQKRIPEAVVTAAFNGLMERMEAPEWTRISIHEFHAFRFSWSLAQYPGWVVRTPDGNFPKTCRPVEALYVIYLLYLNGGVSPRVREAIAAGQLPPADPAIATPPVDFELRAVTMSRAAFQRRQEYSQTKSKYFESHPGSSTVGIMHDLFDRLGIR